MGKVSYREPFNSQLKLLRVPSLCSRSKVLASEEQGKGPPQTQGYTQTVR